MANELNSFQIDPMTTEAPKQLYLYVKDRKGKKSERFSKLSERQRKVGLSIGPTVARNNGWMTGH